MEPSELSSVDLLLQFSEESGELIQAISKLIRKERGTNPTPVSANECRNHLIEEIADVAVVLDALVEHWGIDPESIETTMLLKGARWTERLSQ